MTEKHTGRKPGGAGKSGGDRKPHGKDRKAADGKRPYSGGPKSGSDSRKPSSAGGRPHDKDRKPYSGGGKPYDRDRKPTDGNRPNSGGPRSEDGGRKPYSAGGRPYDKDRKPYSGGGKPYDRDRKPSDGQRPYSGGSRSDDAPRKPYAGGGRPYDKDRKPYSGGGKPYDRDRKPSDGQRPYSGGSRSDDAPRKPYAGGGRPYDKDRKPYSGGGKPYDRDRKPSDGQRPYSGGSRSEDTPRKPYAGGGKPYSGGGKPYDQDRKPYSGGGKPYDRDRKPYAGGERPSGSGMKIRPVDKAERERNAVQAPVEYPAENGTGPQAYEAAPVNVEQAETAPRDVAETAQRDIPETAPREMGGYDREDRRPAYSDRKPAYSDHKPGYADRKPGYADRKPGYADRKPSDMQRKPGGRGGSLTQELTDLEYDIANLIAKRTELLGRSAKARLSKGLSLADPNQERSLRRAWDVVAGRESLEVGPLRGIFTLANGLAYAHATKPEIGRKAFFLSPHVKPVDLAIAGPRSLIRTRLLTAVAAAAGADCTLTPIVLNDLMIELVKALNQAGGGTSWEGSTVRCQDGSLAFADKTVFAGSDLLNLYLLLAFALPQVGRMTFTGGAALKVHDLGPAAGVFAGLGGRLTAIEPYAPGLPARLESAGMTHNTFRVPDDFPTEAAVALAVAGPTYPEGIRFTWSDSWAGAHQMRHAAAVLRSCGVPCELTETGFSVARGAYAVPATPSGDALPMDPLLAATLLAVPRFAGGRVALNGTWPKDDPAAAVAEGMLRACGLELEISAAGVASRPGPWPMGVEFDATDPEFVPLAVALGLAAPGDARIIVDEEADSATAETVAERVGRFARVKPGRIVIVAGQGAAEWLDPERRFSSPSAAWTLALSLVSMRTANIGLANPGGLSEVWPGYITLFSDNFTIKEKEPEADDGKKKGRRVRLD